jgi:hypothetical protein
MANEAAQTRKNENNIFFSPKSPIRLLKIKNKTKNEITPEMEVAKARPPILSGNIKIKLKIIFNPKTKPAILVGVSVSLSAKKQLCNILVPP